MNKTQLYFLLAIIFFFTACKTKRDVTNQTKPIPKDEIEYSKGLILNNIKFANLGDKLFSSSYSSLDMLVKKMEALPYLNIKIVSYYGNIANEDYNERLAIRRAKAVKDYLVSKNIDENRIITEGFGDKLYSSKDYEYDGDKTTMVKVYYRNKEAKKGFSNPIILKEIKFGKMSDKLFSSSYPALNKLATYLNKNSGVHIQINAYTDNEGDDNFNLRLTEKRAKAIKRYLIEKKVPANQIICKGMGEADPILPNNTKAGRRKNNRIEVSFFK